MLDVFRFAWFAVRTFFGVIALVLTLYAALWAFVKVLSAAPDNADPGSALRRVKSYNAQAIRLQDRKAAAVPPPGRSDCNAVPPASCSRDRKPHNRG
jgi:hypothetical protein